MKGKLTLQQRLILPILLLGLVTLLSNILAVFSINNVNANAGVIVDEYMVSEAELEKIRHAMMNIHRLALSHIIAADHATMIQLVNEIKAEEAELDKKLVDYEIYISEEDRGTYDMLLEAYASFKHSLISLVCASADSKTQEAYAVANGDVANYSNMIEEKINTLYDSVSTQAETARAHLFIVYLISLLISVATLAAGIFLVLAAFRIIRKYVIAPIKETMHTLKDSSEQISDVVGEVRGRTKTSNESVKKLSALTDELSAAFEEIASNAAAIRSSASNTQSDAKEMTEECTAITKYSIQMRGRAETIEQTARSNGEDIRKKTEEIVSVLNEAIEKSQNINQIKSLIDDILSISSSTDLIAINASIEATRAGTAGKGFAVVAQEIRKLADSCAETAVHIQDVSAVVTNAVDYLSKSAQELVDYLSQYVLAQFEMSVQSGLQYREDAAYVEHSMAAFEEQTIRLQHSMEEIASSIASISEAIDGALPDITGTASNTHMLAEDMDGITARMDSNQEIVGELKRQMEVFANL